jgi:hypothetical protein
MSAIEYAETKMSECVANGDNEQGHIDADELMCNLVLSMLATPPSAADIDRVKHIIEVYRKACNERWWYA